MAILQVDLIFFCRVSMLVFWGHDTDFLSFKMG